jgi:hypothetical protein
MRAVTSILILAALTVGLLCFASFGEAAYRSGPDETHKLSADRGSAVPRESLP